MEKEINLRPYSQMEEEIDLRQYFLVMRHWLWLIVGCTLLAAIAAFVVSSQMPPVYSASATLLVHQSPGTDMNAYTAILTSERQAETYTQMLSDEPVLEEVIAQLELEDTPGKLVEKVEVELVSNTQLIRLSVEDTDPGRAARITNAIADIFTAQNKALQNERYAESLVSMQQQGEELFVLIEETQAAIDSMGTPETSEGKAELAQMATILAGYRNSYATLLQSYEKMRLTATQSTNDVIVYRRAHVPGSPIRPRVLMNTVVGGVLGAMLAIGGAFLAEFLDDTIRTPDDVSQALSLGTLGAISRSEEEEEEEEGDLVTIAEPLSHISEAFRVLRTNIRFAGVDKPLRTILITSAGPGDGKTSVLANLGVVMAQAGLKVAMVDGDLRRPQLHKRFGLHPQEGLTVSLLKGITDGMLQTTQVDGLLVLPAGELPPNPAEMLGSQRMRDLLDELVHEVDVVLVDTPPVLPVTDAAVLAQNMDGVIVVIAAGETKREMARRAVENLRQVGVNPIGVVLNRVHDRKSGDYYYYHHDYYGDGEKSKKRKRRRQKGPLAAVRRLLGRRRKDSTEERGE